MRSTVLRSLLRSACAAAVATAFLVAPLSERAIADGAAGRSAAQSIGVARPALWSVADADTTVFLFGSIHALREDDKWLFPELRTALAEADAVYFEAPTDLLSQAGLPFLIARLAFNPEGQTLSGLISSDSQARLQQIAPRFSLKPESLEPMRPWYAFMVLSAAAALSSGAEAAYGVDAVMELEARSAGKEVRTFETLEQQIRFFADLDLDTQVAVLEASLEEFENVPDQLDRIIEAWTTGDQAEIERLALDGMAAAPKAFFDTIYTRRNVAWAETLDQLMRDEPGVVLVVVGAAHLVGDDAVQTLLGRRGYAIERR